MVPRRGLEPPRPCERQHVKLVRLPIPPSGHGVGRGLYWRWAGAVNRGRQMTSRGSDRPPVIAPSFVPTGSRFTEIFTRGGVGAHRCNRNVLANRVMGKLFLGQIGRWF